MLRINYSRQLRVHVLHIRTQTEHAPVNGPVSHTDVDGCGRHFELNGRGGEGGSREMEAVTLFSGTERIGKAAH